MLPCGCVSPGHGSTFRVDCHICSCFAGETVCSRRECPSFEGAQPQRSTGGFDCLQTQTDRQAVKVHLPPGSEVLAGVSAAERFGGDVKLTER